MMYYKKIKKRPSYIFLDFKKACKKKNRNNVFMFSDVLKDADKYFNLRTKNHILDFVCNDGLKNRYFINTTPWRGNPDKNIQIMVDAYEFITGYKKGYIAFMHSNYTNKWIIKSFHLSENVNDQMLQAIKKSDIMKKLNLEE